MASRKISKRRGAPATHERRLREHGYRLVAGVDEVGRGALAGPVVAAAAIMPDSPRVGGVNDSKQLTRLQREQADEAIRQAAVAWGIGWSSADAIDATDILRATHVAMRMALSALDPQPDVIIVDGRPVPGLCAPCEAIVGGDRLCYSVAAASIIAKVYRDRVMARLDGLYPGYGLATNVGYGSAEHLSAILQQGPSSVHRLSFEPMRSSQQTRLRL